MPKRQAQRNEYNATALFDALEQGLSRKGLRLNGLTQALSDRWNRTLYSVYRYQTGLKRLPMFLVLDLHRTIRDLGDKRPIETFVKCDEAITTAPSELYRKLRKQERTHGNRSTNRRKGKRSHASAGNRTAIRKG